MLYHASPQAGLRELIPHVSTHAAAWVYAIQNPLTALLFGAPKDDFDFLMDEVDGKTVLWECYPGALKKVYSGKRCSLYELDGTGFLSGQTGWAPEWVCATPVKVRRELVIPDLYAAITEAAQRGACILHEYAPDDAYLSFLREELSARVAAYGITRAKMAQDPRFSLYFQELLGL